MKWLAIMVCLGWVWGGGSGFSMRLQAHSVQDSTKPPAHSVQDSTKPPGRLQPASSVGVTEMLGQRLSGSLWFRDETGATVFMKDLLSRPLILLPAYYLCSSDCGIQIASLALALSQLTGFNIDDYRVVTVSFNADEGPEMALAAKANFLPLAGETFSEENWRFITGDSSNIQLLLTTLGYSLSQKNSNFNHPNVLIMIAADGTIIRYLHGPRFLPFDLGMALTEARAGTPGPSIRKALTICFEYDLEEKKYTFQYLRVFGLLLPVVLVLFYLLVLRKGNQR